MNFLKRIVPRTVKVRLHWVAGTFRLAFGRKGFSLQSQDYDSYFEAKDAGTGHGAINSFQRFRAEWVLQVLKPGDSLLDVSCGNGTTLRYIKDRCEVDAKGTEFSRAAIEHLRASGLDVLFHDVNDSASIDSLPEADYVTLFEILEHMPDPEAYLTRILGKARKGVFFSFPNTGYLPYRIRLLFGSFPQQWILHPGEHLRFWTLRDLRWWLRCLGLDKGARIRAYEGYPLLNRICPSLGAMALIAFIPSASRRVD